MAIKSTAHNLKFHIDDGMKDGKQRVKTRTFKNINAAASDENIIAVKNELNKVLQKEVLEAVKVVENTLA